MRTLISYSEISPTLPQSILPWRGREGGGWGRLLQRAAGSEEPTSKQVQPEENHSPSSCSLYSPYTMLGQGDQPLDQREDWGGRGTATGRVGEGAGSG